MAINSSIMISTEDKLEKLDDLASEFKNRLIFEKISNDFDVLKHSIFEGVGKKLSKFIFLESNLIRVPISEVTDFLNFTIFVEVDRLIAEKNNQPKEIRKFSDIMDSNQDMGENFFISEVNFTNDQIVTSIIELSKNYTQDIEISNDYLTITFNSIC